MSKMTSYIIRTQAFVLALLVLTLSSGYTYHWEGCLHADASPACAVVDQNTCCCSGASQAAACLCSDMGDGSCDLSFSKYIQFDFEAQPNGPEELQPKLAAEAQGPLYFSTKERSLQNKIFFYKSPPPKTGRETLHLYSVLVV